jgi:hypothetical protein
MTNTAKMNRVRFKLLSRPAERSLSELLERISKPPFERLASNLRSVLIKEVISYGMYKEG